MLIHVGCAIGVHPTQLTAEEVGEFQQLATQDVGLDGALSKKTSRVIIIILVVCISLA